MVKSNQGRDMKINTVLLDTSFFIRLLNEDDLLHENALDYYRYFLSNNYILKCSTISIAEYCIKGTIDELPLNNLQILPFNINHAEKAGLFGNLAFEEKKSGNINITDRRIIPNDIKLFAQADIDETISYFVTSDSACENMYKAIRKNTSVNFEIMNIRRPYNEQFGVLF